MSAAKCLIGDVPFRIVDKKASARDTNVMQFTSVLQLSNAVQRYRLQVFVLFKGTRGEMVCHLQAVLFWQARTEGTGRIHTPIRR